jgi:hypothetical protein
MTISRLGSGLFRQKNIVAGEVQWGDETVLVNAEVRGSSFAPKGKEPAALAVVGTRQMFSTIAAATKLPHRLPAG